MTECDVLGAARATRRWRGAGGARTGRHRDDAGGRTPRTSSAAPDIAGGVMRFAVDGVDDLQPRHRADRRGDRHQRLRQPTPREEYFRRLFRANPLPHRSELPADGHPKPHV